MKPARSGVRWARWLIGLAALAGLLLTLALGRWQLSRAAEKEAWQAAQVAQRRLPPLDNPAYLVAAAQAEPPLHRRVELHGRWSPDHTVFLDNRQMNGRPGFFVLTPLQLDGSGAWVLVQRGWVPRDFQDRSRLPALPTASGPVQVLGRMATAPSRLYEWRPPAGPEGFSRIRQNLDLEAFRRETGLPLLPGSVVQTEAAPDGLARDWYEAGAGTEKHYGYAFQWFGLAGLITILYVWFQIVRPYRRARPR